MRRCRQTVVDPSLPPPGMEYSCPSIPPLAHAGQPPIRQVHRFMPAAIIKPEARAGACLLLASPHLHVLATGTHHPLSSLFPRTQLHLRFGMAG